MGMRIGSANALAQMQSTGASNWQQNFKALSSAINTGNLSAAKSAYTAMTAGKTPPPNSPLAQLGQAISSGSVGSAQQALQNFQASRGAAHHALNTTATVPSGAAMSGTFSAAGSLLNLTA